MTTLLVRPSLAAAAFRAATWQALGRATACLLWADLRGVAGWLGAAAEYARTYAALSAVAADERETSPPWATYLEGYAAGRRKGGEQ